MTLMLIALGVAMDATAVSGALAIRGVSRWQLLLIALNFGAFQSAMSLAGALGGTIIAKNLASLDHWIAFVLLAFVGGKMIWEAISHHEEEKAKSTRLTAMAMLSLGVATSLDALAVGATLPTLGLGILLSIAVIGGVTFVLSLFGAWAGKKLGERFGSVVEVVGGLVLIGIGVRTVVTHLSA
ncbi:MAG: manganese efflux pump MntP family protein [Myxococcaceae bacterium]